MAGCTSPDEHARAFLDAAAHLASEALLLVDRDACDDVHLDLAALGRAVAAAEELALLARSGAPPRESYEAAARAVQGAARAVAAARLTAPPRRGARRPLRRAPRRSSSGCS